MSTILALGADIKASYSILRGGDRIDRSGFGDLSDADEYLRWKAAIEQELAGAIPEIICVDMHPLYISRRFGLELARRAGARLVEVQHHHAHAMAALDNFDLTPPALALVMDGTGYGSDGTIWGCELIECAAEGTLQRRGHLECIPLPGGDRAAYEPWRTALSWLKIADVDFDAAASIMKTPSRGECESVRRLADSSASPMTSSCGRLFDAVAVLLGLCETVRELAEAPRLLEAIASSTNEIVDLPVSIAEERLIMSNCIAELFRLRSDGAPTSMLARSFHRALSRGLTALARRHAQDEPREIIVTGGCMANALLREFLAVDLRSAGLTPLIPPVERCFDSSIAIGQIMAARIIQ